MKNRKLESVSLKNELDLLCRNFYSEKTKQKLSRDECLFGIKGWNSATNERKAESPKTIKPDLYLDVGNNTYLHESKIQEVLQDAKTVNNLKRNIPYSYTRKLVASTSAQLYISSGLQRVLLKNYQLEQNACKTEINLLNQENIELRQRNFQIISSNADLDLENEMLRKSNQKLKDRILFMEEQIHEKEADMTKHSLTSNTVRHCFSQCEFERELKERWKVVILELKCKQLNKTVQKLRLYEKENAKTDMKVMCQAKRKEFNSQLYQNSIETKKAISMLELRNKSLEQQLNNLQQLHQAKVQHFERDRELIRMENSEIRNKARQLEKEKDVLEQKIRNHKKELRAQQIKFTQQTERSRKFEEIEEKTKAIKVRISLELKIWFLTKQVRKREKEKSDVVRRNIEVQNKLETDNEALGRKLKVLEDEFSATESKEQQNTHIIETMRTYIQKLEDQFSASLQKHKDSIANLQANNVQLEQSVTDSNRELQSLRNSIRGETSEMHIWKQAALNWESEWNSLCRSYKQLHQENEKVSIELSNVQSRFKNETKKANQEKVKMKGKENVLLQNIQELKFSLAKNDQEKLKLIKRLACSDISYMHWRKKAQAKNEDFERIRESLNTTAKIFDAVSKEKQQIQRWKRHVQEIDRDVKSWRKRTEKTKKYIQDYQQEIQVIRNDVAENVTLKSPVTTYWTEFLKAKEQAKAFYEKAQGKIKENAETSIRYSRHLSQKVLKTEKLLQQTYLTHDQKIRELTAEIEQKNECISQLKDKLAVANR